MKIKHIRSHAITVPFETTYYVANQVLRANSLIIVEVETDDGVIGIGTAHGRSMKQVVQVLTELEGMLVGMDAAAHEAVWQKVFGLTTMPAESCFKLNKPALFGASSRTPILTALAAIDIALWDLKGKALKMPVWRLLGATRTEIMAYVTCGYYEEGRDPHYITEETAAYVADGYNAIKIKVGGAPLATDVSRVRAVREAIGKDAKLMVDGNGAYTLDQATDAIHAFEPYDIFWFEEPLHWYDSVRALGRLSQRTSVSLASGESEPHAWACRDLVDFGGIRYLEFDATRSCGVTEWLRVAAYAHAQGVLMATHHDAQIQGHLAVAVPNGYCVETFPNSKRDPLWEMLFTFRAEVSKGLLRLNDEPGFGFGIDWKVVEKYRV